MLEPDAPDLLERRAPRFGQVERVGASVDRAVSPLEQPAVFQLVEQQHQAAWKHAELLTQGLLTEPVVLFDDAKDAGVRRCEPQRRQALRKPCGGVGAYLREQ